LVIDPWGTVLADAGLAPGLAMGPIDTGHSQRVRQQMPSLRHRHPTLF
jgi:nitrilase